MRGVGFISSPLLQTKGYVSNQMIHVTDWLPTLYTAAGGKASDLQNLYGIDQWGVLQTNGKPVRTEILHNIDPLDKTEAIRVGDYKLLHGPITGYWDGWYPPYQLSEKSSYDRMQMGVYKHTNRSELAHVQETGTPVTVKCGPKPANASTNCQANKVPCLYHIPSDPCEYNNIASSNMDIVTKLLAKIVEYKSTMMVPPGNKPFDPAGNPRVNGGIWRPWLD